MSHAPITWVELCCGAAATTLRLVGGPRLQPVVSWMGGKRRQASAILEAMGLEPRQPVERIILADAGPWGWVWPVLLDPELAPQVAEVLGGWSKEDPRELWQRLAAEKPAIDLAEQGQSKDTTSPVGGIIHTETVAERSRAVADVVARWLVLQAGNYIGKPVHARDGRWITHGFARPSIAAQSKSGACFSVGLILDRLPGPVSPGWAVFHGDVADIDPIPGAYAYIDPPYVGKTGYGWDIERARVLALAQRWSDAGCVVAVSEAVPLDLEGWHHVDLGPCGRKGAGPEWLTMNRVPAAVPARQIGMFGAP